MRNLFKLLTLAIAVSLVWAASPEAREPRVVGDRLVFTLTDLDGERVASSDDRFDGRVVFVTVWGTWCPPCRTEIPTFIDLHNRYADEGLVIVGIAFERDTIAVARKERLRKFSKEYKINYLILDGGATTDFSAALPMVENVKGLPIEIIIDRSGVVVDSRNSSGYRKKWARRLEGNLKRLLAEPPPVPDPCTPAWFEHVERKVGVTDADGHGPDLGSDEWRSAVEFKLGIRGDAAVPARDNDAWCDYINAIIEDL